MKLNEIMKNTADAIREKKGTTDLIAPVDFASQIKSISAGGGESGDSGVEYVVQTLPSSSGIASVLWERATLVKVKIESYVFIDSPMSIYNICALSGIEFKKSYIEAMCVDFKAKIVIPEEGEFTIEEILGPDKDFFTPITKEQFYNLNVQEQVTL